MEFRTSPYTKPGTYSFRVEKDSFSDDVSVEVQSMVLPVSGSMGSADKVIYHPLINPDIPTTANNDLERISRGGSVLHRGGGAEYIRSTVFG